MRKILNLLLTPEYRRDMSEKEKFMRDIKIFFLILFALLWTFLAFFPLHAETVKVSNKFEEVNEWICPNPNCRYDNYDGIRYCGLCGTERGSRKR